MAALLFSDSGFSNFIRDLALGHGVVMEDAFDFWDIEGEQIIKSLSLLLEYQSIYSQFLKLKL
jgi:hypothetical protein